MKKVSIINLLCLGNLIGCLTYLYISKSVKYDYVNTAFTLTHPVSYGSACAALFFGLYLSYGIVSLLCLREVLTELELVMLKINAWHLIVLGAIYILHYLEILTTDNKFRISFIVSLILLLSLKEIFKKR